MRKNIKDFQDIHHHCINPENNRDHNRIVNLNHYEKVPSEGYYSIGIHPWKTSQMNISDIDNAISEIACKAKNNNIVAIGECGIDMLHGANKELQEYAFRRQIELSEKLKLPLIIHMVKTSADIIRLKKELKPEQLWVIHGFRGKPELARQLTQHGIGLSFGKLYNKQSFDIVDENLKFHETDED